nr:retrovirus-related Pol polyprotein from transposon TNT 1-94 [Tanacetum cinerariifolium]
MLLYIRGKEHGKELYDLVINGPFQFGTVDAPATPTTTASTRPRTFDDLTDKEKIREAYLGHSQATYKRHRTLTLINDMNMIGMTMKKLQVNTKFVNNVQSEWSKFGTDVKLAKDMHKSSFDQLYAYLRHHELRTLENPRNQANIQDIKVTMQNVQGRQAQSYAGIGAKGNATVTEVNRNMRNVTPYQSKVIRCYNFKGEGVILDEEQLAFLADTRHRVDSGLDTQTLPTSVIFQIDNLDAFDSDSDKAPLASVVLMDKLSACDSDVLFEVPNYNTYQDNNVIDQSFQEI